MTAVQQRLGLAVLLGSAAFTVCADETFRCGKWLITSESSVGEIVAHCGPPASRTSRTEDVRVRNRNTGLMMIAGQTTIETLTWDRGTRAAAMVVTIVDGTVKSIDRKQ